MGEKDYIELNNLLTKYRVTVLKELGRKDASSAHGKEMVRQLRSIDNLRNNMILIDEEVDEQCSNE